jgi:phosphoribosyl 1,2-cyclic phosphodiesterase
MAKPSGRLEEFVGWPDPPCRAGTSASILTGIDDIVKAHMMIDPGPTVGDSLASSMIAGIENLNAILISHWHPDHRDGLNQIVESIRRTLRAKGRVFSKIPLFTTLPTYRYLREKGGRAYEIDTRLEFHERIPGKIYRINEHPPIDLVGISVAHSGIEGAVTFAVEMGRGKRVVFLWDIDRPDRVLPTSKLTNLDSLRANLAHLHRPDELRIAINTFAADETTGHTSFLNALEYVGLIEPKQVFITHMSGHEDLPGNPGYGLSDGEWEELIQKHLPGARVALQGMITKV